MTGKAKDEMGHRYGRLVVIKRVENNKRGGARWLCQCDCGNETVIHGARLRSGETQSCGCLQREAVARTGSKNCLPRGIAAFNALYRNRKCQAEEIKKIDWMLTEDQFRVLTKQPCHYCKAKPAQVCQPNYCNGSYTYNGLDRVDNDKGYTMNNVVSCCGTCNRGKSAKTTEEFLDWIAKVYTHSIKEE